MCCPKASKAPRPPARVGPRRWNSRAPQESTGSRRPCLASGPHPQLLVSNQAGRWPVRPDTLGQHGGAAVRHDKEPSARRATYQLTSGGPTRPCPDGARGPLWENARNARCVERAPRRLVRGCGLQGASNEARRVCLGRQVWGFVAFSTGGAGWRRRGRRGRWGGVLGGATKGPQPPVAPAPALAPVPAACLCLSLSRPSNPSRHIVGRGGHLSPR